MRVVFDQFWEHGLKLKPSKCEGFKTEINYLAHHVSKRVVLPPPRRIWKPLLNARLQILIPRLSLLLDLLVTIGISLKGSQNIAAPLYNLTSGENKDKKSEHLDLPQEAREAFDHLKAACLQAPILAFPDFDKPFLLETDAGSCAVAEAV